MTPANIPPIDRCPLCDAERPRFGAKCSTIACLPLTLWPQVAALKAECERLRRMLSRDEADAPTIFAALAAEWQEQRPCYSSNDAEHAMCAPYQQIIGMGPVAVPLILNEMRRANDHWFWALHAITGVDPVKPEHRGILHLMTMDWLEWGEQSGRLATLDQEWES